MSRTGYSPAIAGTNMTIEEIRNRKKECEDAVSDIVNAFYINTGVRVTELHLGYIDVSSFDSEGSVKYLLTRVTATLESI
jgi:hypothetical protein